MPAFVNRDLCNACGECIDVCPTEAISMVEGKAQVDPDECTECYACIDPCPEDALSMLED